MNKLIYFSTILATLFLTSAGCPKKSTGDGISGPWTCISIAAIGTLGDVKPTADFEVAKNALGGFGGCNTYFSTLEIKDGGQIAITGIGATRMACEGERGKVESAYFDVLGAATSYEIKGRNLVLSGRSGPLAVFLKN